MATETAERVYLVQVLAAVEVIASDQREAKQIALDELMRRCERGRDLYVRTEEVRKQ